MFLDDDDLRSTQIYQGRYIPCNCKIATSGVRKNDKEVIYEVWMFSCYYYQMFYQQFEPKKEVDDFAPLLCHN